MIVAACVELGLGIAVYEATRDLSPLQHRELINDEDPAEESVAVKPMIDEEALAMGKLGGKKAVLPQMWDRAPASVKKKIQETPAPPPDVAAASTKAESDPDKIPDAGMPVGDVDEDAGTEEPTDAGPEDGADAGADSKEDAGEATIDPDGGESNATGPGCTGPGCSPDGGLDKLVEGQYLGRLIGFFKRGFVVSGLGLPPDQIKALGVGVSVTLSGDGTVVAFTVGSSGNATFDAAARSAMQGKVGSQVPPPPEDRPDLKRTSLSFTMTCSSSCN